MKIWVTKVPLELQIDLLRYTPSSGRLYPGSSLKFEVLEVYTWVFHTLILHFEEGAI
jgi:hypothetical protein